MKFRFSVPVQSTPILARIADANNINDKDSLEVQNYETFISAGMLY